MTFRNWHKLVVLLLGGATAVIGTIAVATHAPQLPLLTFLALLTFVTATAYVVWPRRIKS
jgi:hypothetical protein